MVPVTWQAVEERKTITPAVWSVSGYIEIPATCQAQFVYHNGLEQQH